LQYIGPSGNDSHSQTSVEVSQKGSYLGSYSKESNPKAENRVYKNFDAHLKCSHKQANKNTAIGNGTILVNKKGQPMEVSLINDFTALATNIEVHVSFETNSGGQTQFVPPSLNVFQKPFRTRANKRKT
jgi:hypothetical protein